MLLIAELRRGHRERVGRASPGAPAGLPAGALSPQVIADLAGCRIWAAPAPAGAIRDLIAARTR